MRKTNKKLKKLAADKYGVILVTVIFIVAMALVFITTALTISIATRQRVYTNAKYQQARLTAISLSQSIWQAIYSQQISDNDLVALAKGASGNGSVVTFETDEVPGMGLGDTVTSAYFYCVTPGDPSKIGIECKCDIDGTSSDGAAQYYTIILERHKGEDTPPSAWPEPFRANGGGVGSPVNYDSINLGINAAYITDCERNNQVRYIADDNIAYLHNCFSATPQDGCGYYCDLIVDSPLFMQELCVGGNVYFVGQRAGFIFGTTGHFNAPRRNLDGSTVSGGAMSDQAPTLYFMGTDSPFLDTSGNPLTTADSFAINGARAINFDRVTDDSGNLVGFEHFNLPLRSQNIPSTVDVNYENPITFHWDTGYSMPSSWDSHNAPWSSGNVPSHGSSDAMDTISDVVAQYGGHMSGDVVDLETVSSLSGGHDYIVNANCTLRENQHLECNVSSGDIVIYVTNGAQLTIGNQNSYMYLSGSDNGGNLVILLDAGSSIHLGYGTYGARPNNGIIDPNCFYGSNYFDVTTLNQHNYPHVQILSLYEGGYPVRYEGNGGTTLTANLGFFPMSDPNAGGGGQLQVYNCNKNQVYYGRISCGGVDTGTSGNYFNVPYCPGPDDATDFRTYAYRDNTDFSIVNAYESNYGFFATNG